MKKKDNSGLTFIELMVVVAIISFSLPLIFGLLFINLRSQSKTSILQEVKRNGDFALNTMGFLLRQYGRRVTDANYLQDLCSIAPNPETQLGSSIHGVDRFGKGFTFFLDQDKIASSSPDAPIGNSIGTKYFTGDKVVVDNLEFSCQRPQSFSPPIVSVSFDISQSGDNLPVSEEASLHYQTRIRLRN